MYRSIGNFRNDFGKVKIGKIGNFSERRNENQALNNALKYQLIYYINVPDAKLGLNTAR